MTNEIDLDKREEKFESLLDLQRWLDERLGECSGCTPEEIDEMLYRLVEYVRSRPEFGWGKYVDMSFLEGDKFFAIALGEIEE